MSSSLAPEDASAIRELRQKLWSGRASVMIGAGFSMNADLRNLDGPRFPSWNELAAQLFQKIHARPAASHDYLDPINLASQYEAHAKENGIVSFLAETVGGADRNSQPGELHRMILSLPWTDVYTTNYDTLLERTLPEVIKRRYQIITKQEQIPQSTRPRIVKLHGGFPDTLPMIFTQDHYRRYPTTHAAFINTVQQSIMETALCLVGFSGSDPNFLSWIGWIRDHLGEYAPHVYLCGILNASNTQRQYYDGLRVKPIDLAAMFPESDFHDTGARHKTAITWFLHSLNHSPPDKTTWPSQSNNGRGKRTGEHWSPPPGLPPVLEISPASPDSRLTDLVTQVRALIDEYPGWVVLPFGKRWPALELLAHIHDDAEFTTSLSLDRAQRLLRLHTLTQTPLEDTALTDKIVELVTTARSEIVSGREKLDLAMLAVDLSKCLREQGRYADAERIIKIAEDFTPPRTVDYSHAKYEKCNILIETLNLESLTDELNRWTPIPADLVNTLRHSALVYEFCEDNDDNSTGRHAQVCKSVLHRIRQTISESDLSSLSKTLIGSLAIEGLAELLLWQAMNIGHRDDDDLLAAPEERHLRNSDALADLGDQLRRYLDALKPDLKSHNELIFETNFDSHSHLYRTTNPGPDDVGIHEVIRVLEACGAPYSHGNTSFISSRVGAKLGSLGVSNPLRTLSVLARCRGDGSKKIERHWNVWSIKMMDKTAHAYAIAACLNCIGYCARRLQSVPGSAGGPEHRFLRASLVFCSIAISLCSDDDSTRIFHAVVRCYAVVSRKSGAYSGLMEDTSKCLARIFARIHPQEEHILALASLPMWGFGDCVAPEWLAGMPEAFMHLKPRKVSAGCTVPEQMFEQIRTGLAHSGSSVRYAAILRYEFLDQCGVIDSRRRQVLNRALWSTSNGGGLPQVPFIPPPYYLKFMENCGVEGVGNLVRLAQMQMIHRAESHKADLSHLPVDILSQIGSIPPINQNAVSNFTRLISSTTGLLSMRFSGSLPEGWTVQDAKDAVVGIVRWIAPLIEDLPPQAEQMGGPFHDIARSFFDLLFVVAWPLCLELSQPRDTVLLSNMLNTLNSLGIQIKCAWTIEGEPKIDVSGLLIDDAPIKCDLGNVIVRQWMRWSIPDGWGLGEEAIDTAMFVFSRMNFATCQTATKTVIEFLKLTDPLKSRHMTSLRAHLFTAGLTKLHRIVVAARHHDSSEHYWVHQWLMHPNLASSARQFCQDKDIADAFWPVPIGE